MTRNGKETQLIKARNRKKQSKKEEN